MRKDWTSEKEEKYNKILLEKYGIDRNNPKISDSTIFISDKEVSELTGSVVFTIPVVSRIS